jgi:hypothetical protein
MNDFVADLFSDTTVDDGNGTNRPFESYVRNEDGSISSVLSWHAALKGFEKRAPKLPNYNKKSPTKSADRFQKFVSDSHNDTNKVIVSNRMKISKSTEISPGPKYNLRPRLTREQLQSTAANQRFDSTARNIRFIGGNSERFKFTSGK